LRNHTEWSFVSFAVVLLQMGFLYMMAAVILPEMGEGGPTDLAAHFLEHRKAFFAFLVGMLAASVTKDMVISGTLPARPNLMFHGIGLLTAVTGALFANRRFQLGLAVAAIVAITAYVALLFARL
jgi:hypothetical protein